ncbi:hypothetical protein MUTS3_30690 [Escherichia coli]|nr:hypothetical protein MUTS3_30690 [Escherichia coli]
MYTSVPKEILPRDRYSNIDTIIYAVQNGMYIDLILFLKKSSVELFFFMLTFNDAPEIIMKNETPSIDSISISCDIDGVNPASIEARDR